jgi:hypothetical protein
MDYHNAAEAVIKTYNQVLYAHHEEARDAARRMAEWLGMDPTLADELVETDGTGA